MAAVASSRWMLHTGGGWGDPPLNLKWFENPENRYINVTNSLIAAVCSFALSCWNSHRLEGSICCSKTFIYLPAFIEEVSLLFSPEDTASVVSKKNVKFWLDCLWNTFPLWNFKWAFAQRTQWRFWTMFTYGFLFAWYSFIWYLQWFLEVCFWALLVMSMTESCRWVMQCRLIAWRPQESNKVQWKKNISPISLNLFMILCTVDDDICKAFAIWHWGMLFLKYSTIFLRTLSQIGDPLPIFTYARLCLSKTSFL